MADRPQAYGLTAEVKGKLDGKYDPKLEKEATEWIEKVLGEKFFAGASGADAVHEKLKDGVILCNLVNRIKPESVKKINTSTMAFKMMENIGNFLTACEALGVPASDSFQTVDLYEKQNMAQVINAILSLKRRASK
eukprot:Seg1740.3 transcript_id=Seg1740.3/GoldUCD/mRNA.D3Y31 product="Muscle-specific protein 20" protein_id=Seg1740.3/GoldUCD/D3Y31